MGVYGTAQISVTKMHGPLLLALRGAGVGVKFAEKSTSSSTYIFFSVALEWPLTISYD